MVGENYFLIFSGSTLAFFFIYFDIYIIMLFVCKAKELPTKTQDLFSDINIVDAMLLNLTGILLL